MKVTNPLNYKRKPYHTLEILAFDGSSHTTCQIKILVEKSSENYLTASQACFEARLKENQKNVKSLIIIPGNIFIYLSVAVVVQIISSFLVLSADWQETIQYS